MNVEEYRAKVIALFRGGVATDRQWDLMAEAVLAASEGESDVREIDAAIMTAGEFAEVYDAE